jgi:hypothetical protein
MRFLYFALAAVLVPCTVIGLPRMFLAYRRGERSTAFVAWRLCTGSLAYLILFERLVPPAGRLSDVVGVLEVACIAWMGILFWKTWPDVGDSGKVGGPG